MYKKSTLQNGLRIITLPIRTSRSVTVLVLVGTGSKYETKETNGISHFLEHMFFKGTKKRPNTLKLIEPLDRVGGNYNAFTGKEYTGFWAKVESSHLDLALDWVSDIYLNSKLSKKDIEKEKGVILQEINMYLDTPIEYISDLWEKLLYGDQPAGWLTIGRKENILRFQRKDLLNYRKLHYSAKNTLICLAGKVEPSQVEKKVKKYFKGIKIRIPKGKPKVIEEQTRPQVLVHFKKTDQTHLCLGVRAYSLFHPMKYAQAVLSTLLGGYMSSRIFLSVREKNGLSYYIKTTSHQATDTGYLVTQTGVDHQKVAKVIKLILKEYRKIKEKEVSKSELQKAKDNLKGQISLSLESSDFQASFYSTQELLTGKILTPRQKFNMIDKVTSKDILKVAKDIFRPKKLNLALIGPFRDKRKFEKLLKI
ncbi:insulinase family protein [bacterium]|nr:insulinase family protein [bacterium]